MLRRANPGVGKSDTQNTKAMAVCKASINLAKINFVKSGDNRIGGNVKLHTHLLVLASLACTPSASLLANPLEKLPEIANAKEGMQLISRDAFGPLKLGALIDEIEPEAVHERFFTEVFSMEDLFHGASLTENYGRISIGYLIAVESDVREAQEVFNLTKEQVLDHFSSLDVGEYEGNQELNDIQREYKWKWDTEQFECEATYNYWERAAPYFHYDCNSKN